MFFTYTFFVKKKNTQDGQGTVYGNFSDLDRQPKSETF